MGKEFSINVGRLHSGDIMIGRLTPDGKIINPFFIIVDFVKEKEDPTKTDSQEVTRKRTSLRPFIELIEGLTTIDDNYFVSLDQESFSNLWPATPQLASHYMNLIRQMAEYRQAQLKAMQDAKEKKKKEEEAMKSEKPEEPKAETKETPAEGPTVIPMPEPEKKE